jgi:hypothetical protein
LLVTGPVLWCHQGQSRFRICGLKATSFWKRANKRPNLNLLQIMQRTFTSLIQTAVCLVLVLGLPAMAQDKKVDPNGTWKWSFTGQNGQSRETTLTLKLDGDKLTGKISGRGGETDIEEAKLKGEDISFQVTREFNDNKFTTKYVGKISGDTIKGKTETERDGQTRSRDWEAKREAAK